MRYILLLLFIPLFTKAQNNFNLKGELKGVSNGKKIYLVHVAGQAERLDSTKITNGNFEFNIELNNPSIAILLLDHSGSDLNNKLPKDLYRFFIEPGKATLTATDSIAKAKIKGLAIADAYSALNKSTASIEENLQNLNKEFSELSDKDRAKEEVVKGFQERYKTLITDRKAIIASFIENNPNSYVSLHVLNYELANDQTEIDVQQLEKAYTALAPQLKELPLAKAVAYKLEVEKRTGIGVEAIDFEEKTAEGIAIKLSSFRGQYVLVDFWASWCGPCRQENPTLVRAYEMYKSKNFNILGVSIDTDKNKWVSAVKQDGLLWTQLLDRSQTISQTYDISSIPRNFLIDPSGKIIAKNLRGVSLLNKLEELFK